MTESISRRFYRRLLRLYPEPFRNEFEDEMLGMFEECRAAQGSWRLLADGVFSAAKQQIRYVSTPVPKSAVLYAEIASSPDLARIFVVAGFGVLLIAGMLTGAPKRNASESWTMVRSEVFTFPLWENIRAGAEERRAKPESAFSARARRRHRSG